MTANETIPLLCPLTHQENPLDESEKKFIRKLSEDDMQFFKNEFYVIVMQFIRAVSSGLEKAVNKNTINLLLDLTYEKFYDDMTEMEEKQPLALDTILSAHFVTKFLTDILQFSFAYFVQAKPLNAE